jgi:hypothetical protein
MYATAGVAAAAAIAVVTPAAGHGRDNTGAARKPAAAPVKAVDTGDRSVCYDQYGATVRAAKDGDDIADMRLTSFSVAGTTAKVHLTVTAKRPILVAPDRFTLGDSAGNENSPTATKPVHLPAGTRELVLEFRDVAKPEALLWVPQDEPCSPDAADVAGNWVLPPTLDAGDAQIRYSQKGKTVTATVAGARVASLTLDNWRWSARSGDVVLTVDATRPFTIDPQTFNLAAHDSNENAPTGEELLRIKPGKQRITLHFDGVKRPGALLWAPQEPQDADDDGIAADWNLSHH